MKNPFPRKKGRGDSIKDVSRIPENILKEYRAFAGIAKGDPICKAPFLSMRFNRNGGVTPCCQNFHLDSVRHKSLMDVWNGNEYNELRKKIRSNDLSGHCDFCKTHLLNRNYGSVLASHYKHFNIGTSALPKYLDFSIDNTCNLQCVMCNGSLSSVHQSVSGAGSKDPVYHETFFQELETIIPQLEFAIFSGGEPFMIAPYFRIWERMFSLNPELDIVITTNATILNDKIKALLEKGRCSFNVSIDTLDPDIYEQIRKGAHFDRTFENLKYLIDYCRRKSTSLTLAVCPMKINWRTLPDLTEFCIREKLQLYFNLVTKPIKMALWTLSSQELTTIHSYFIERFNDNQHQEESGPVLQIRSLINQLESWIGQANYFQQHIPELSIPRQEFSNRILDALHNTEAFRDAEPGLKASFIVQWNQVLKYFPDYFCTSFFITRILQVPAAKIIEEVVNEDCSTTAANFSSLYYYARGDWYSNRERRNV